MSMGRREFLRTGLLATGAAAGGVAVKEGLAAERAEAAGRKMTVALTPDGQLVAVPTGAPAVPLPPTAAEVRRGIPGRKWVMVIDLAKCDGCGNCVSACRKAHFIPTDREWIRLYKKQDSPETAPYWFPKPCFHCDNPPCTKVCPVGATFKRDDGIVLIDNERCIGCRFCMAACPFSARVFNWSRPDDPGASRPGAAEPEGGLPRRVGTVEKCDFCPDNLRQGKMPHCVMACDMTAIYFGDQNEDAVTNSAGETVRLAQLLRDRAGYRHLDDLGTSPRVYYLPPSNRRFPAPGEAGAHTGKEPAPVAETHGLE